MDVAKEGGMENPLAFNPSIKTGRSCKLVRALNGVIDLKSMKKKHGLDANFKITWGDGSRGGRGKGNTGNIFEAQLEKGLNDWIETNEYTQNPYKDFIKDLIFFADFLRGHILHGNLKFLLIPNIEVRLLYLKYLRMSVHSGSIFRDFYLSLHQQQE